MSDQNETTHQAADEAKRPTGRDEVVAAVVKAATELFAERGIDAVTVRDVASRVGVSHALVHRYFGSKQDLLIAVIEANATKTAQRWAADYPTDPNEFFARVIANGSYLRMLMRAAFDGLKPEEVKTGFSTLNVAMDLLTPEERRTCETGQFDPRIVLMVATAALMAFSSAEDFFLQLCRLQDEDRDKVHAEMAQFMSCLGTFMQRDGA